ncbi:UNVERIFIED_CONTAM: hypothetical protein Sangu_1747600 [Sesamum angustifolium]|uniref:Uncharacterized protein n=1 Tax=Sesamum angustifolium TaxID=2727405 RepID=A0AAW2M9C9_9LAMI
MSSFWNHVLYIIKIAGPLVKVLRLVDGERKPPMGYIYEVMDRAKEAIAASFSNTKEKYKDVFALIDARWNVQLHRLLHAAGYYLNLEFYYANSNVEQDEEVMQVFEDDDLTWGDVARAAGVDEIFEDDDLTWGDVARAAGVDEDAYSLRPQSTKEPRGTSKVSASKASKKASSSKSTGRCLNLISEEEEEEEENFDDSNEEERLSIDLMNVEIMEMKVKNLKII